MDDTARSIGDREDAEHEKRAPQPTATSSPSIAEFTIRRESTCCRGVFRKPVKERQPTQRQRSPRPKRRTSWLGDTRDSVLDKAQQMARTTAARAQEAAAVLAGDAASRMVGGTPE